MSREPPLPRGGRWLALYPGQWRARYEAEMLAALALVPPGRRVWGDLLRGALDAHLHPPTPSRLPALAAIVGGALWMVGALAIAVQPVPPDWPGYLIDVVPLALAAVCAWLVAVVGCWLRLGDGAGGPATIAIDLAVAGYLAWGAALAGVLLGLDYGASTAIASTAAGLGTIFVGLALARAGDWPIAGLVVAAPVALLIPSAWAWIASGAAWLAIGLLALRQARRGPAPA